MKTSTDPVSALPLLAKALDGSIEALIGGSTKPLGSAARRRSCNSSWNN